MENTGHLQTPINRFMDHTDLHQLRVKGDFKQTNKNPHFTHTQAEAWHRRKIRSSASRLALAERKPNTMQPIHNIFFITVVRAARQCFQYRPQQFITERQELAGNTPIISAMKRKQRRERLKGDRKILWCQTSVLLRADQLIFSTPKKSDRLQLCGSYKTGTRAAALWLFQRNKPRKMKIFQWQLCCPRSPGCLNQGSFVASLAGWCWIAAANAGLGIQHVEGRQPQRPAMPWGEGGGDSLHGACWQLFGLYYKSRLQSGWCPQAPNTDMFINKRAQMEKIWKVWEGNKGWNKQISLKWSKERLKWQMVCTDFVVPLKGTKPLMSHGCVHTLNSPTGHKYKLLLPVASNKYYCTTISNQLAQQRKVLGAIQTCNK